MIVTAWNNGQHYRSGAGYGLKVSAADRDKYFNKEWKFVVLQLEGNNYTVEVNINKPSFWGNKCRELISKEIGVWLHSKGLAPWPKGSPPKLIMEPIGGNCFSVHPM